MLSLMEIRKIIIKYHNKLNHYSHENILLKSPTNIEPSLTMPKKNVSQTAKPSSFIELSQIGTVHL